MRALLQKSYLGSSLCSKFSTFAASFTQRIYCVRLFCRDKRAFKSIFSINQFFFLLTIFLGKFGFANYGKKH